MPWDSCKVYFDTDKDFLLWRDYVTGTIILEFTKETYIRNLYFSMFGFTEVQWTKYDHETSTVKTYSEKRKLLHVYFDDLFNDTFNRKIVKPGVYRSSFELMLYGYNYVDLLSSLDSRIAKVYYYTKVEAKGWSNATATMPFVVLGNVKWNCERDVLEPTTHILKKICWKSKYISMKLKTYLYLPSGQNTPLELTIENENEVKISKIRVHLIQKITCNLSAGSTEVEKRIHTVKCNKMSNTALEICNFNIDIPSLTPSTIDAKNFMVEVSYVFRVEVHFPFYSTHREDIPVTITPTPYISNK